MRMPALLIVEGIHNKKSVSAYLCVRQQMGNREEAALQPPQWLPIWPRGARRWS